MKALLVALALTLSACSTVGEKPTVPAEATVVAWQWKAEVLYEAGLKSLEAAVDAGKLNSEQKAEAAKIVQASRFILDSASPTLDQLRQVEALMLQLHGIIGG